jgi:GntR family transcriptional regulator
MNRSIPIDPNISQPIFHQIKNYILSQIANGELRPNDQLPSEREYQALMGASRQTVRRALDELVIKGVLYRQPGKGTYVSNTPIDKDIVGVVGSISMLVDSPEHEFVTKTVEERICPGFASELLGIAKNSTVIFWEHVTYVRKEPRLTHRSYIPLGIGKGLLPQNLNGLSILEGLVKNCGQMPVVSHDHLCPGLIGEKDAQSLDVPVGSAAQVQRGVILSQDGSPIEAHEIFIRGDKFKLDISFPFEKSMIDQISNQN